MHVQLADFIRDTPDGDEAAAILGKCVHCGFCTATCPTYRLLGDELDGPRGRIYLIKSVVEGAKPTATTQLHLDRCLTCRACETTCPSGVQYGRLVDIGRQVVDERVQRGLATRVLHATLRAVLTRPRLFATVYAMGQALRPLLPQILRDKLPRGVSRTDSAGARHTSREWPQRSHRRSVLLLAGCVQPGLTPNVNVATARVLDAIGLQTVVAGDAGCCGAIRHHLDDQAGGLVDAKRNVDAWWPYVEGGIEAIVMNASGCGAQVREYGYLLRNEHAYANKAAKISALTCDIAELLSRNSTALTSLKRPDALPTGRVAFHPPCTLQHAQKVNGVVEALLSSWGATVLRFADSHICCGSAGTYSVLQPKIATQLRDAKLAAIEKLSPDEILSANVGCITHLAATAGVPVRHWVEWLDDALTD